MKPGDILYTKLNYEVRVLTINDQNKTFDGVVYGKDSKAQIILEWDYRGVNTQNISIADINFN